MRLGESSKQDLNCDDLLQQIDGLKHEMSSPDIHLCRGKDVIAVIVYILPHLFHSHFGTELPSSAEGVISEMKLAKELRKAYKCDYLKGTSLFNCIQTWEDTNKFTILDPEKFGKDTAA